jgi:hypothetical protein
MYNRSQRMCTDVIVAYKALVCCISYVYRTACVNSSVSHAEGERLCMLYICTIDIGESMMALRCCISVYKRESNGDMALMAFASHST